MMNALALLPIAFASMAMVASLPHPPTTAAALQYDTKFDNVDLDEILGQERLLINYVKCLEGMGPCTPDAKMLKEILPDAVSNECAKCSERQRYGSQKVTHYLIDNRPDDWTRLERIYDPQGNFRMAYLATKAGGSGGSGGSGDEANDKSDEASATAAA